MKNVFVTGASGGIGSAIALAFSRAGYGVALGCHKGRLQAQALVEQILGEGGNAVIVEGDVSREDEVEVMFREGRERLGFFSVLVNNAGISQKGLFTDLTLEDWNRVLGINLTGAFLCCREALPPMISRKQGAIINISSMWGQVGASCEAAYSASKAGLIGLTKALAKEEGPSGIRVNCIAPGVIDTSMNGDLGAEELEALREETPMMKIGLPEDVARTALFLAEEEFITGQILGVNGGFVI